MARVLSLDLPAPDLDDNQSHEARLRAALVPLLGLEPEVSRLACQELAHVLPTSGYRVQALVVEGPAGWDVATVVPPGNRMVPYGLAVDLGSSTVVFHLVDLRSGEVCGTISRPNPQAAHGEDILERILFAGRGQGLSVLQSETVLLFNRAIKELVSEQGDKVTDVVFLAVAGNTTMCHFLLGLDPAHLCKEPYIPVANRFDLMRPQEIGLEVHAGGWLYCFPNVGSYFGGDLLAGILASGLHRREELSILVDVGTNAEVLLGNRDWMVACAGAAGPALEGGILSCGMRAGPGAVERVDVDPVTLAVRYRTIGGERPRGLCGSGVIDLLAAMFMAGLVDPTGKLVPEREPDRMGQIAGEWAYVVAGSEETADGRPLYVSQSDIKNLIRSKGAMFTILNVVVQSVGIGFEGIERFYVAGAFGSCIDPQRAVTIGMLPDIPLDRFRSLGNAAGDGAVEVLQWRKGRQEVEAIRERITYLEMNVRGDFMNQLTGALFLPHTNLGRFPSVAKRLSSLRGLSAGSS